jgi:hypothetical protein
MQNSKGLTPEKIYAGGFCLMHGLALVNKNHGGPEALSFTEVFFVFPLCLWDSVVNVFHK